MAERESPLLVDLYELAMMRAYFEERLTQTAVFEFFVRRLPPHRGFLMAAGLAQVVDYLEGLRFETDDIAQLERLGGFDRGFLESLADFRFIGDVEAMAEGTVFFENEPILRVTAPLPQAQFVETRIINLLHYQTLVASKAARFVLAAPGKTLVDFGLRRAHGAEAGLLAARASYIAGFAGTAAVLAGARFDIPLFGTMAHSFVQAHENEAEAFLHFARSHKQGLVLLIDTYDTERAAELVVRMAGRLAAEGIAVQAVRIDSGNLAEHAMKVRAILDRGGCASIRILASGGLDEDEVARIERQNAPIDSYGIGTSLVTSSDAPALDCAYKLEEYAGVPKRKRSEGKATWPGRKQVWRHYDDDGTMIGDIVSSEDDDQQGTPLLHPVMRAGRRIARTPMLEESRALAASELARLPPALRQLKAFSYPVEISPALRRLAEECDRRIAGQSGTEP